MRKAFLSKCLGLALTFAACALSADAQINGEYRSQASGPWTTAATWQTYSTATSSWSAAAAAPSGATAVVTVRNTHVVQLTANVSFKKVTIESGGSIISDASERRMDFAADTSYLINNGNLGGASASNTEKIGITNTPACTIATITGTGTTSVARIRFNNSSSSVTQAGTLVIDHDMNITSSGLTAYYNTTTNTAAENATITIMAGRTVTAGGGLHNGGTTLTNPGGNYTYNIYGTLDMSATGTTTYLQPLNNPASVITVNVYGTWKVNNLNANYSGTNTGSVVLNIQNGGLVDASRAATFNMGTKYWIVSGSGKLKRPVSIAAGAMTFPIGTSASSYNPVTLTATTTDDTFAVGVRNALSYAIGDPSKIVTKQWEFVPNGSGAGFNAAFNWQTADQAAAFSQAAPLRVFRYSAGPPATWSVVNTPNAITGAGTIAAPFNTTTSAPVTNLSGLYVVGNSDASVVVVPTVAITAAPAGAICAGTSVTFTASTTNITGPHYQWKVDGANVGTDQATYTTTALTNGQVVTCVISYTAGGTAAATSNGITMSVNPLPAAGTISGAGTVCSGTSSQLTSSAAGGTWTTGNAAVATVSSTGLVTGIAVGNVTITYTVTNGCGTATATQAVAVTLGASAGTISGATGICPGATTIYTSSAPGGAWSSSNTAAATVSSTGAVTGVAAGSATIAYVVVNGCGTDTARKTITVNPAASAGTISGSSVVCTGATTTLSSTVSGGTWSSNNANATVSSGGVVTGVTIGTAVITYTATNSCGTATATRTMTISTTPSVAAITGPTSLCPGSSVTLASTTTGGVWTSSNGNASVGSTGIVTGVSAGTSVISYTVSNTCGSNASTATVTVGDLPAAATISGPDTVCLGGNVTMSTSGPAGSWTTRSGRAVVANDGLVTGISAGPDTLVYNVTNTCGTASSIHPIFVKLCYAAGVGQSAAGLETRVFPNPNHGDFSFVLNSAERFSVQVSVTNMLGEVVESRIVRTGEIVTFHLSQPAGVYFLNAVSEQGRSVTKINIAR